MLDATSNLYVTLPSNGSSQFYPTNTVSNYKNKLAQSLSLEGAWEVGLVELQYPRTWKHLKESAWVSLIIFREDYDGLIQSQTVKPDGLPGVFRFPLKSNMAIREPLRPEQEFALTCDILHIELPAGNYTSPENFANFISREIANEFLKIKKIKVGDPTSTEYYKTPLVIEYDTIREVMVYKSAMQRVSFITYGHEVLSLLGLTDIEFIPSKGNARIDISGVYISKKAPAFLSQTSSLYIYSDIVESERVGDAIVPLLRAVAVSGEHGKMVSHLYERVYYKRVTRSLIDSIQIQISDDTGANVDFTSGKVACVLHFKKCSI
jgi:hypothetical protein